MQWKKLLSGLVMSTFIFGVSVNTNAASLNDVKDAKQTYDKFKDTKDKVDKVKDGKVFDKDNSNKPPEPPKDSNGKFMPPPDKSTSDFDKAKDKYDNAKKDYNKFKNATK